MSISRLRRRLIAPTVLFAIASFLAWPAAAGAANTFSGRAKVVDATVLGTNTVLVDTGPVAASGGQLEESLLDVTVPGLLTAEVGHAAVVAGGDRSSADASVANLDLTVAGQRITAELVQARATASCQGNTARTSASSELVRLTVNNEQIVVAGTPNQTVELPLVGGKVIINEQIGGASADRGDVTVNALHVVIPGVADVIVAQAHADITCAGKPACPSAKDFITGGGFILSPSGAQRHFAVAGGLKNGGYWGHLVYSDRAAGLRVKGTSVTGYDILGPTTRRIRGTAEINGRPGTYEATVSDNGEPGRSDAFQLTLSNGYSAGGTLAGGNIQLHLLCK